MIGIKNFVIGSIVAFSAALVVSPIYAAAVADAPASPKVPALEKAARDTVAVPGSNFSVLERQSQLTFYPCSQCHDAMQPNPKERVLYAPHVKSLEHANGKIWCTTCHSLDHRDKLTTLRDKEISFNEAYRVCEQCHAARAKDWQFGGHGKRVSKWQGERVIYSCTECHNPHAPIIPGRKAQAPPPGRAGLPTPTDTDIDRIMPWERERNPITSEQTGESAQ